MNPLLIHVSAAPLPRREQFVPRRIIDHARNPAPSIIQTHRNAKHREAMSKVRGSVQRVDVPAVIAARVLQSAFFAEYVMGGPVLAKTLPYENLRITISHRDPIRFALDFTFYMLPKAFS